MKLKLLHILCTDDHCKRQLHDYLDDNDCVVEQWMQKNEDSTSLYYMVKDPDQELFDDLQSLAEEEDTLRFTIMPIDASYPHEEEEEEKEEEENKPGFFEVISREEMREEVSSQASFNGSYLSLAIISAIVATIAILTGNIAILIGAMVLAPLLGPNLALAFATATNDKKLITRALLSGGAGIFLSFGVSFLIGTLTDQPAQEGMIKSLVEYGFESIPIAICAGLAATILLLKGTVSSLIGVMVAVAFLPPLSMAGLALAHGEYYQSFSAAMLFAINLAAFNLSSKCVLLIAGVRPHRNDENHHSFRAIFVYVIGWTLAIALLSVGLYYK